MSEGRQLYAVCCQTDLMFWRVSSQWRVTICPTAERARSAVNLCLGDPTVSLVLVLLIDERGLTTVLAVTGETPQERESLLRDLLSLSRLTLPPRLDELLGCLPLEVWDISETDAAVTYYTPAAAAELFSGSEVPNE